LVGAVDVTDVAAAGAGAGAVARTDAVRVVTVRVATVAGFATAVRAIRVTVRVCAGLAWRVVVVVDTDVVVLVSLVAGGVSGVTGGASTVGGGLWVVTGAGSVGCVCCPIAGVEESATAAAIAGRALVSA